MPVLHDIAHFVRWRLIPLRYAGKFRAFSVAHALANLPPRTAIVQSMLVNGYHTGPTLGPAELGELAATYRPRTLDVVPQPGSHPFVNLFRREDIHAANPVIRLAFSPKIIGIADDYFGGRLMLDSLQVLYSWPTHGELRESQMWHKDYGDSKSFHWVAYLNDVAGPDDGPFAFVDKKDSRNIGRSVFIRRIGDRDFNVEVGTGRIQQFLGRAGESLYVDPATCYHSGSRCKNPRLAIFITFNSDRPFVDPVPIIVENRVRIADVARQLRPDLSDVYIKRLLGLR